MAAERGFGVPGPAAARGRGPDHGRSRRGGPAPDVHPDRRRPGVRHRARRRAAGVLGRRDRQRRRRRRPPEAPHPPGDRGRDAGRAGGLGRPGPAGRQDPRRHPPGAVPYPRGRGRGYGTGRARVTSAISVGALTKRYGEIEAVRGIDFEVPTGETFGFLGPNGAGKSTTINILCTLARPTAGTARVAGHDVVTERDAVRRTVGLVFQDPTLDIELTAEQNLRFHAELYGVPKAGLSERIDDMLRMVGLADRRGSQVLTF